MQRGELDERKKFHDSQLRRFAVALTYLPFDHRHLFYRVYLLAIPASSDECKAYRLLSRPMNFDDYNDPFAVRLATSLLPI